MKYVIKREEFIKKLNESSDKEQVINEVMSNDIGWGDSLVGRLFASVFRMAKMGVDTKRIDYHLASLKTLAESTIVSSSPAKEAVQELRKEADKVADANAIIDAVKADPATVATAVSNIVAEKGEDAVVQAIAALPESTQSIVLALVSVPTSAVSTVNAGTSSTTSSNISQTTDKPEVVGVSEKGDIDKIQKIKNTIESLKKVIADKKAKGEDTTQDENQLKVAEGRFKAMSDKMAKAKADKETAEKTNTPASTTDINPSSVEESHKELLEIEKILETISISLGIESINEELLDKAKTNSILNAFRKQINKEIKEISPEDAKKELPSIVGELDKFAKESTNKIAQNANETGKKYEAEIKNTKKILADPIEVLRIFNNVNRIIVKGVIPSVRTGGKVSSARANNWERLDGSSVDPNNPGSGPFRNIKLFSKWNDGVLALMKDKELESFFNTKWILVDGAEKQVKYSITSFITDMLNDSKAFGNPGYQKKYLQEHFGVQATGLDTKTYASNSDSTENAEDKKPDGKEMTFVATEEKVNIINFSDKKCFRVKATYKINGIDKEGYVYFVGYNNILDTNETINKDIFKGSKLFQVSLDNDYFLSRYTSSTYKAKDGADLKKNIYQVVINDTEIVKDRSYNLYALPPLKRTDLENSDPIALDIRKVSEIEILTQEGKTATMKMSLIDKDNALKKAEKWFAYTQKETIQVMYDKFAKMKGFRA